VTRATRLWPAEQLDVARELVTHFQDALEEVTDAARETGLEVPPEDGARVAKLVADFGDPDTTARLIRRARLRSRPLPARLARAAKHALLATAAPLALVYGVLFIRFHSEESSVPPEAVPTFVERNNTAVDGLPEGEKAWPVYHRVHTRLAAALDAWPLHETADPEDSTWRLFLARPGDAPWPHLVAFLETVAVREALREVRAARTAPHLGFRFDVQWSEMGDVRTPAGPLWVAFNFLNPLLAAEVARALEVADGALAHESLVTLTSMARQAYGVAPMFCFNWLGFTALESAEKATDYVLERSPDLFSERHLVDLAHRFSELGGPGSSRRGREAEREEARLGWDRLYANREGTSGRITRSGLERIRRSHAWWGHRTLPAETLLVSTPCAPVLPFVVVTREALEEKTRSIYAAVDAQLARPFWERDAALLRSAFADVASVRYLPFQYVRIPRPWLESGGAELIRRDATLALIALELFRRRHGRWPEHLQELVPAFLPALPLDQFDGQPLRYRLVDGKPLLYSIGGDRDDDGGRRYTDRKRGGDWILREP